MKIHHLVEGDVGVRIDKDHLPDLDDLMLDVVREEMDYLWFDDDPTVIDAHQTEPEWQWVRISPCFCGEHGWHWDSRRVPDDKDLLEDRPARRFVALHWGRYV